MDLEIVYEDSEIAVCVKPAGMSSEADGGSGVPDVLAAYFREKSQPEGVFTVHRLDREASGLIVYARTKKAAASLSEQIRDGAFVKEYEALVCGEPVPEKGELRDFLFKDSSKNKVFTVKRMRKGVREAVLKYGTPGKFTQDGKTFSLVHAVMETGRTHQIRVQFASRGLPVLGDLKYGGPALKRGCIALQAVRLSFRHPGSGEQAVFERPLDVSDYLAERDIPELERDAIPEEEARK
jgi:23S rRNA pseudouridine1911/1915/1917 synthase